MKKLMIAAAIVCAAVFAQAATVQWGVDGVTAPEGGSAPADSYWAYCFLTADSSGLNTTYALSTITAMIQNGEEPYDLPLEDGGYVSAAGAVAASADVIITGASEATPVTMHAYAVIIDAEGAADAKNYMVVDCGEVEFIKDATLAANGVATEWQSVAAAPEPTSGLLLLLGVAGLALKRRRA